jgi:hypothetical protein
MTPGDDAGFLARWSRRKARGGADAPAAKAGAVDPAAVRPADIATTTAPASTASSAAVSAGVPAVDAASSSLPAAAESRPANPVEPLPTLEDVAALTRSSDYARFVRPGVDPTVKNAALKKLFSDPHFNVMDGLDTYIDDYGKPDPIPIAMLRQMNQAKFLGLFDDEEKAGDSGRTAVPEAAAPLISPDGAPGVAVAESGSENLAGTPAREPQSRPDDDADLRLQQDDAARRPGTEPGSRP